MDARVYVGGTCESVIFLESVESSVNRAQTTKAVKTASERILTPSSSSSSDAIQPQIYRVCVQGLRQLILDPCNFSPEL